MMKVPVSALRDYNKLLKEVDADKVSGSIERLSAMPGLGTDAAELSELLAGYLFLPLKCNTFFYRVHDDEQLVEILRIYDNRMDIIAHLLNDR